MQLRDYQRKSVDLVFETMVRHPGNPCLVLPTGAGKSHVVAVLCKEMVSQWPFIKILMLTHQKELIEQNAAQLHKHWPGAPVGVYSAGIGRRELGEPITFGGVQSLRGKAQQLGHVDVLLVDECHMVGHKPGGGYRTLIDELAEINPKLRVIGLTATPWRLGHGLITEGEALFDHLLEPTSIEELVHRGFLAPLRSKHPEIQIDVSKVRKRGGEFVEKELQAAVDQQSQNEAIASEIAARGADRKHWLLFCTGIEHAQHMQAELERLGVSCGCLTGKATPSQREEILARFRSGEIRALTNCNVLTTGFDFPDIDLLAFIRPTMSPVLYVQMGGRGMRIKDRGDCLVLDFAGLVETHGPITAVQPPKKAGKPGEAPTKVCPECDEIMHLSALQCAGCGYEWPPPEEKEEKRLRLHNNDIMGEDPDEMSVGKWEWRVHTKAATGQEMLCVSYLPGEGNLVFQSVQEFFCVAHGGQTEFIAKKKVQQLGRRAGLPALNQDSPLAEQCEALNAAEPPSVVYYTKQGRFFRVTGRHWVPKQLEMRA